MKISRLLLITLLLFGLYVGKTFSYTHTYTFKNQTDYPVIIKLNRDMSGDWWVILKANKDYTYSGGHYVKETFVRAYKKLNKNFRGNHKIIKEGRWKKAKKKIVELKDSNFFDSAYVKLGKTSKIASKKKVDITIQFGQHFEKGIFFNNLELDKSGRKSL